MRGEANYLWECYNDTIVIVENNVTQICTVTKEEKLQQMWDTLERCEYCEEECAPGCSICDLEDAECKEECFVYDCGYDLPACNDNLCSEGCLPNELGDDFCHLECNNTDCEYDKKDCEDHEECKMEDVTVVIDPSKTCKDT